MGIYVGLQVPSSLLQTFLCPPPNPAPMPRVSYEPKLRVLAICNYSGRFSGAQRSLNFVARAKAKLTKPHLRAVGFVFSFLKFVAEANITLASSTLSSSSYLTFLIFQLGCLSCLLGSLSFFFRSDLGTIGM